MNRAEQIASSFKPFPANPNAGFVHRFFRLEINVEPLYQSWRQADTYLGDLSEKFRGLRIVLQQPEECLLSFICSTANFIPRIMKAIGTIARTWGEPITGQDGAVLTHSFPRASVIAELDPYKVSELTGLEWRAGNLVKVARQIADKPRGLAR